MHEFIPIDKSRAIKCGLKDLERGVSSTVDQIRDHELGDDLRALVRVTDEWFMQSNTFHVGESGTLLRGLWWLCQTRGIDAEFVREGTLRNRNITLDPSIIDLDIPDLLKLDGGTSQYASMAILFGRDPGRHHLPDKTWDTLDLVDEDFSCPILADANIVRHATACLTGEFTPVHSEDACLAIAMGLMTPAEAKERWPQIVNHESNRAREMDVATWRIRNGKHHIFTQDHRVIQAMAITHALSPEWFSNYGYYVSKSWPKFWQFMRFAVGVDGFVTLEDAARW